MSKGDKDELIEAQRQAIGILFEIVQRLQANSDLDREYLEIVSSGGDNRTRMDSISDERLENAKIIMRLLEMLGD